MRKPRRRRLLFFVGGRVGIVAEHGEAFGGARLRALGTFAFGGFPLEFGLGKRLALLRALGLLLLEQRGVFESDKTRLFLLRRATSFGNRWVEFLLFRRFLALRRRRTFLV